MFDEIDCLARKIESVWARTGHADGAFSEIAARWLDEPLELNFNVLARRIFKGGALPIQRRLDGFGQPALSLYTGERFLIEALCWHTGTPAIHHHAFTGAFRVLTGRSVQSRYTFTETHRVGAIAFGDLELDAVQQLDRTSTTPIPRGAAFIHSAFHLDNPSMTIVARTHQSSEPEFIYLRPGIAYDPAARSVDTHKRLQLLDTLNQTGHEVYADCVRDAIDASDLYEGMQIVMRTSGHQISEAEFLEFAERLSRRHGRETGTLIPALIEERRRSALVRMRQSVTDPDARYVLAVLLSFSNPDDIMDAMAQRYGERARAQLVAGAANLFGGDGDRRIIAMTAVDAMLDGEMASSFPDRASSIWKRQLTEAEVHTLETFYVGLTTHPLLTPLWRAQQRNTETP
jgi:hypothetical protein